MLFQHTIINDYMLSSPNAWIVKPPQQSCWAYSVVWNEIFFTIRVYYDDTWTVWAGESKRGLIHEYLPLQKSRSELMYSELFDLLQKVFWTIRYECWKEEARYQSI